MDESAVAGAASHLRMVLDSIPIPTRPANQNITAMPMCCTSFVVNESPGFAPKRSIQVFVIP